MDGCDHIDGSQRQQSHGSVVHSTTTRDERVRKSRRKRRSTTPTSTTSCLVVSVSPRLQNLFRWMNMSTKKDQRSEPSSKSSSSSEIDFNIIEPQPPTFATHAADEVVVSSGKRVKEDFFNLAIGFGLFHLVAASKNEVNKMIELRKEMEMIIDNARKEFNAQSREKLNKASHSNQNPTDDSVSSIENQTDITTALSCNQYLAYKSSTSGRDRGECVEGIDQLEAELESELERCLQLQLDNNTSVSYSSKQSLKEVQVEDSSRRSSVSPTYEEQCGVSPHELERRLHELLQSRQQERIEELEAALQYANQKISEREREICWWKDTAHMFSRHVPTTSSLSR